MLQIVVPGKEMINEDTYEFISTKETVLRLEHSLVSISKWESKWKKPFLDNKTKKTYEESIDYIRCMTLNQNIDPLIYYNLTADNFKKINEYIDSERTATWFREDSVKKPNFEIVTSELIYYWMTAHNIPFECQKWHLSRLLTLIRICNIKNSSEKKMSKAATLSRNRSLNAARRKAMHTKG